MLHHPYYREEGRAAGNGTRIGNVYIWKGTISAEIF